MSFLSAISLCTLHRDEIETQTIFTFEEAVPLCRSSRRNSKEKKTQLFQRNCSSERNGAEERVCRRKESNARLRKKGITIVEK